MKAKEKVIKLAKAKYSKDDYRYHIIPVVKNSEILAKKTGANLEVVEVAAYLHDIAGLQGLRENNHHIEGAEKAVKILGELGYEEDFIKQVEHCILTHRGRGYLEPKTKEAKVVASADAMAHFDTFLDLFRFFLEKLESFEETVEVIEGKMERDWERKLILPEAKEMIKEKYDAVNLIIKSMKKYM
ncbi:MAG: HD domain-containing protein [archaeon]